MPITETCFSIKRGDNFSRTIIFEDADGSPIDVTGWELRFTVKAKITDPDSSAVIAKVINTFSDPTSGIIELELTSTDTNQIIGSYLFDIQIKTANNEIFTILEGIITITQDVTQES